MSGSRRFSAAPLGHVGRPEPTMNVPTTDVRAGFAELEPRRCDQMIEALIDAVT